MRFLTRLIPTGWLVGAGVAVVGGLAGAAWWFYDDAQDLRADKAVLEADLAEAAKDLAAANKLAADRSQAVNDLADVVMARETARRQAEAQADTLQRRLEDITDEHRDEAAAEAGCYPTALWAPYPADAAELMRDAYRAATGAGEGGGDAAP